MYYSINGKLFLLVFRISFSSDRWDTKVTELKWCYRKFKVWVGSETAIDLGRVGVVQKVERAMSCPVCPVRCERKGGVGRLR